MRGAAKWVGLVVVMACGGAENVPETEAPSQPTAAVAGSASAPPVAVPAAPPPMARAEQQPMAAAKPPPVVAQPRTGGLALPSEVCQVLQANGCVSCHQGQLQGGAPMPLQWRADFMGKAHDGGAMSSMLLARVQDAKKPMPPVTTMRPLPSADQVGVLRRWVESGMPGAEGGACEPSDAPPPNAVSWSNQPWPESECEYVMTIGAHGTALTPFAQDPSGYEPPETTTSYHCFYEQVPWGDKPVQALATRVHVEGDDKQIAHHTVLSALAPNAGMSLLGGPPPTGNGDHQDCPNPSGSTVSVWAPGPLTQTTLPMESGVLMPSGAGAYIELQVHYNNAKAGMKSRVRFDICATSKLRPNTAGVHWLGYENATAAVPLAALGPELQPALDNKGGGVATGSCKAKQRTRLLWIAPHMHELGKHSKIEILRKDGTRQLLHDAPFDFSEQTAYNFEDLWIEQGESILTTCTWDPKRKVVFGFASNEEMCFFYTLAYPIGALAGQGAEKGVVGGELNCAGAP